MELIFVGHQLEDAGVIVITDPVHFGPGMLKLLGRKESPHGMSGVGLGQVRFAAVLISLSRSGAAQYEHDCLDTGIP